MVDSPIRKDSAELYTNVANFRKILIQTPDIPAELLREMLTKTLDALELLTQAIDRAQDTLELVQRNRG